MHAAAAAAVAPAEVASSPPPHNRFPSPKPAKGASTPPPGTPAAPDVASSKPEPIEFEFDADSFGDFDDFGETSQRSEPVVTLGDSEIDGNKDAEEKEREAYQKQILAEMLGASTPSEDPAAPPLPKLSAKSPEAKKEKKSKKPKKTSKGTPKGTPRATPKGTPKSSPLPSPRMASAQSPTEPPKPSQSKDTQSVKKDAWLLPPTAKAKYLKLFPQADKDGDGFVGGAEARSYFAQSGLPKKVLRKVWILADTEQAAKLTPNQFVVAFHIMMKIKHEKLEVPETLPECLVKAIEEASD